MIWISSKEHSHIRDRHIHLCTRTLLCVCRNASQIHTPALAAWQVDARALCIWHLCQRLLHRKQESSQNVPLHLKNRPPGGHTYGLLRTCGSLTCSLESLPDPQSVKLFRNAPGVHEERIPMSFQHSQRDFSSTNLRSDNTHVGAGTRWQHRPCPTLV